MHDLGTIPHTQAGDARAELLPAADDGADSGSFGNLLRHLDAVSTASCGACASQDNANAPRPDLVPPEVPTPDLDGCGVLARQHGLKCNSRERGSGPCRRQHCCGRAQGMVFAISRRSPDMARGAASARPSCSSTLRSAAVVARGCAQSAGAKRQGRAFSCSAGAVAHPAWASLLDRDKSRAALAAQEGALARICLRDAPPSCAFSLERM